MAKHIVPLNLASINKYLAAYDSFYGARASLKIKGNPKFDSQVSESIAANKIGFTISHKNHLDGYLGNDTFEVKGTGYKNDKAHFAQNNATRIIWVKLIAKGKYEVREMSDPSAIYSAASSSPLEFVDLSKFQYTVLP